MPSYFPQTLVPAYGRDYKSSKEVKADLLAGKDFRAEPSGQMCSIRDLPAGTEVIIRYRSLRQVMVFKVPAAGAGKES